MILIKILKCDVDGCNITNENLTVHYSKSLKMNLCSKHKSQYDSSGEFKERTRCDKNDVIEYEDYVEFIIRNKNLIEICRVKLDKQDMERCHKYKWCLNNKGLVCNSKVGTLGAYVMKINKTGKRVIFINGDKLDCRKQNLSIDKTYIQTKRRECKKQNTKSNKRTRYTENEILKYDTYAEIILYNNKQEEISRTKVDIECIDKCREFKDKKLKWYYKKSKSDTKEKKYGYVACKINGKEISLHRYILNYYGEGIVDHINNDPLDNRKKNLRITTVAINNKNKRRRNDNLGVMGVRKCKDSEDKFDAYIHINGKQIRLGRHTEQEAIKIRLCAEKIFGFKSQEHLYEEYGINDDIDLSNFKKIKINILDIYKSRVNSARSHSKSKGLESTLTLEEYIQILEMFTDKNENIVCAYCNKIINHNNVIDHIVASANGGGLVKGNVVVACDKCNKSKQDYDLEEWYRRQPFYSKQRLDKILKYMDNPSYDINSKILYLDILLNREKNKYFKYINSKGELVCTDKYKETANEFNITTNTIRNILNKKYSPRYDYNFEYCNAEDLKIYFESKEYEVRYLPNKYTKLLQLSDLY